MRLTPPPAVAGYQYSSHLRPLDALWLLVPWPLISPGRCERTKLVQLWIDITFFSNEKGIKAARGSHILIKSSARHTRAISSDCSSNKLKTYLHSSVQQLSRFEYGVISPSYFLQNVVVLGVTFLFAVCKIKPKNWPKMLLFYVKTWNTNSSWVPLR